MKKYKEKKLFSNQSDLSSLLAYLIIILKNYIKYIIKLYVKFYNKVICNSPVYVYKHTYPCSKYFLYIKLLNPCHFILLSLCMFIPIIHVKKLEYRKVKFKLL